MLRRWVLPSRWSAVVRIGNGFSALIWCSPIVSIGVLAARVKHPSEKGGWQEGHDLGFRNVVVDRGGDAGIITKLGDREVVEAALGAQCEKQALAARRGLLRGVR